MSAADSSAATADSGVPSVDSGVAPVDASVVVVDAALDAGPTRPDAATGVGDAGRDAAALVCAPPTTTPTYTLGIQWAAPAAWGQSRCTAATVQGFLDACLGRNASVATCNAWKSSNTACSACLLTSRNATPIGPFVTNPAVTPDAGNPAGLDTEWVQGIVSGCLNHFRLGCGPAYFSFASCLDASCDTSLGGNCSSASATVFDICQEDAIGEGQGVCGPVALAALGPNGVCRGVFPVDAGSTLSGADCFARGSTRGEDTTTQAGIDAFLKRVALYVCGP